MHEASNRRSEDRLTYLWPMWFSEDFSQQMSPGLMLDISTGGITFSYSPTEGRPREGQAVSVSLSVPRLDDDDPASTVTITATGRVSRVETLTDGRAQAAVCFDTPLDIGPVERVALEIACPEERQA